MKRLSEEEQEKYLKLATQENYDAQQTLLEHNLGLVNNIITTYFSHLNYNDKEEIFQIGSIGLWEAIINYKPEFNTKLSTYAYKVILGKIKTHFRDNNLISVPTTIQNLSTIINRLQKEFENTLSEKELENLLGVSEEDIILALNIQKNTVSLSDSAFKENNDKEISLEEIIQDPKVNVENELEKNCLLRK